MFAIQDRKRGVADLRLAGFPDPATLVMAVPVGPGHTQTHTVSAACDQSAVAQGTEGKPGG